MDRQMKDHARLNGSTSEVFEPSSNNNSKQRSNLISWINTILPDLNLPINASDEELRAFLVDGTVLCRLINKLKPGSVTENNGSVQSSPSKPENVQRFLSAMDAIRLPRFQAVDLEKGSMKMVLDCLLTLQTHFMPDVGKYNGSERLISSPSFGEEKRNSFSDSRLHRTLRSPVMAETSSALLNHVGIKFHEVFQLKQGSYNDIPAARISEMMKSNSLDNAPTQSLLSVVSGILDESIERKNGEIPHRVACLLRKVMQEIERRMATQAEHLRTQNNLFKTREEKYQKRIRVLEALATGTSEETEIVMNQLQQIKSEKNRIEEKKKVEDLDVARLSKEKDELSVERKRLEREKGELSAERVRLDREKDELMQEKSNLLTEKGYLIKEKEVLLREKDGLVHERENLKRELDGARKASEQQSLDLKAGVDEKHQNRLNEVEILLNESRKREKILENRSKEIENLLSESKNKEKDLENRSKEIENLLSESEKKVSELENLLSESKKRVSELENLLSESKKRVSELENLLAESKRKAKELEASSELKSERWNKKEHIYQIFTEFQLGALRELRFASQTIQQELVKTQKSYSGEFNTLGSRIRALDDAAKSYYSVLSENQKLHNELQELKGNIRVYCRVRPNFPGQKAKQSIIEYIGENGEIIITNPAKTGKDGRRSFKFDKVYGPASTQGEVFSDVQPLIQSVLDGYNVCIFAYGQTGSGKTYTMTGPDKATEAEWGVNYRALNNLFRISQSRQSTFTYEISVQMVEIYNEQVRDLLSNEGSQKRLGILSASQSNGLAVPDASMHGVNSTSDVLELMDIGLKNRARSSTALNQRSSRSHSVVSIHVRGTDLKSGSSLRASLHLVDLAGSERVDRSEVTGDRLKEAQHINKSLSALGDVIFALAQKSSHVPYRNSKLTQVLQSSLGGQAKTLMFVQITSEVASYSETASTLKFAERVSGVELGAAKSSKDGRDVRELMEQVASLKDTIAKKDEEIESLQMLKDPKNIRYGSGTKGSEKAAYDRQNDDNDDDDDDHDKFEETDGSQETSSTHDEAEPPENTDKNSNKSSPMRPRLSIKTAKESPRAVSGLRKSSSRTSLSTNSPRR